MRHVAVIAVGKLKERWMAEAISEYAKRLSRFCRFEVIEVPDEPAGAGSEASGALAARALEREGARIVATLSRLGVGARVAAADIRGEQVTSERFAEMTLGLTDSGRDVAFLLGGSFGFHASVLERADWRFSMSRMTFPHQIARIVLVEQIYRAYKINAGETYHK